MTSLILIRINEKINFGFRISHFPKTMSQWENLIGRLSLDLVNLCIEKDAIEAKILDLQTKSSMYENYLVHPLLFLKDVVHLDVLPIVFEYTQISTCNECDRVFMDGSSTCDACIVKQQNTQFKTCDISNQVFVGGFSRCEACRIACLCSQRAKSSIAPRKWKSIKKRSSSKKSSRHKKRSSSKKSSRSQSKTKRK
jgi:hypothetical protein